MNYSSLRPHYYVVLVTKFYFMQLCIIYSIINCCLVKLTPRILKTAIYVKRCRYKLKLHSLLIYNARFDLAPSFTSDRLLPLNFVVKMFQPKFWCSLSLLKLLPKVDDRNFISSQGYHSDHKIDIKIPTSRRFSLQI